MAITLKFMMKACSCDVHGEKISVFQRRREEHTSIIQLSRALHSTDMKSIHPEVVRIAHIIVAGTEERTLMHVYEGIFL
jgi:hypothetical protein